MWASAPAGRRCQISGFCKQIFDTAKLSEESLDAAAWTLETVKIAMHNLDQREKRHGR